MEQEIWKNIEGTAWYQVSNFGRVRSIDHIGPGKGKSVRSYKGRILKQSACSTGYAQVSIYGDNRGKKVHRLVAKAFLLNPAGLPEVNHKDGDKMNSAVSNLEWVTPSENCIHAYNTKLNSGPGTIPPELIREIFISNLSHSEAAAKFNIGKNTVQRIRRRVCYARETENLTLGYIYNRRRKGESHPLSKQIIMKHPDGYEEAINGIANAARRIGVSGSQISRSLKGSKKWRVKGYEFRRLY